MCGILAPRVKQDEVWELRYSDVPDHPSFFFAEQMGPFTVANALDWNTDKDNSTRQKRQTGNGQQNGTPVIDRGKTMELGSCTVSTLNGWEGWQHGSYGETYLGVGTSVPRCTGSSIFFFLLCSSGWHLLVAALLGGACPPCFLNIHPDWGWGQKGCIRHGQTGVATLGDA